MAFKVTPHFTLFIYSLTTPHSPHPLTHVTSVFISLLTNNSDELKKRLRTVATSKSLQLSHVELMIEFSTLPCTVDLYKVEAQKKILQEKLTNKYLRPKTVSIVGTDVIRPNKTTLCA